MIILRQKAKSFAKIPTALNEAKFLQNQKLGIISTENKALLKLMNKYGVKVV